MRYYWYKSIYWINFKIGWEILSLSKWETSITHFPSALPVSASAPALESPVPLRRIRNAPPGSRNVKGMSRMWKTDETVSCLLDYWGERACNLLLLQPLATWQDRVWQGMGLTWAGDRTSVTAASPKVLDCVSASSCSLNGSSELFEV